MPSIFQQSVVESNCYKILQLTEIKYFFLKTPELIQKIFFVTGKVNMIFQNINSNWSLRIKG